MNEFYLDEKLTHYVMQGGWWFVIENYSVDWNFLDINYVDPASYLIQCNNVVTGYFDVHVGCNLEDMADWIDTEMFFGDDTEYTFPDESDDNE